MASKRKPLYAYNLNQLSKFVMIRFSEDITGVPTETSDLSQTLVTMTIFRKGGESSIVYKPLHLAKFHISETRSASSETCMRRVESSPLDNERIELEVSTVRFSTSVAAFRHV